MDQDRSWNLVTWRPRIPDCDRPLSQAHNGIAEGLVCVMKAATARAERGPVMGMFNNDSKRYLGFTNRPPERVSFVHVLRGDDHGPTTRR